MSRSRDTTKTAFTRRMAKNRHSRGVRSLFGMDHVPASAESRDAACLQDRRAAAQEGLGLGKLFRRQAKVMESKNRRYEQFEHT